MKTKFVLLILAAVLISCGENFTPKPIGYPRVYFPEKNFEKFDTITCPFSFEIPGYATMDQDADQGSEPCWYNLNFHPYNATLHISYKPVNNILQFDSMYEDSRRLTMKHFQKADQIEEIDIHNPSRNVYGIIYTLKGNTATNFNFFITDSSNHFLRGALYFNSKTKQDSTKPAYEYMVNDVYHLIETAEWK
jgi:gliding motility-associated lipoprotein GldD